MTKLSVNVNKVALLRNSRANGIPNVLHAAQRALEAGAHGITVHPRPDQRHIRFSDVPELAALVKDHPGTEYNIEGNPFPEFMDLVGKVRPHQCTLVPDAPEALTSDQGWNLALNADRLRPLIARLKDGGARVSLFMDADRNEWDLARDLGADRVELYTEPYAEAFSANEQNSVFARFASAAKSAQDAGLGVNAGHDLNLQNLKQFCEIPGILEVSIGHALIADALDMGMFQAVRSYLKVLGY